MLRALPNMALCGLCEVLFDVDDGNQVEHCWPPGAFSEEELSDIAFTAFPDSMSFELSSRSAVRDSSYAFRLRRRCPPPGAPPHPFLYGHVFCRQRQDERLRRGCEQRSVVLLSFLPLPGLLEPLARLVGPAALSYGPDTLQEVYREVQEHWPALEWGCRTDLPVLGLGSLQLHLPMLTSLPNSALPAAVAAALDHPEVREAQQRHVAAQQQLASPQQQQQQQIDPGDPGVPAAAGPQAGAAADGAGQAVHPATASPADVAAALADELDDATGIPLCLLPEAYGQQELEPSPFGDCDCFTPLRGALPQLWALWELLLLGQPLMVVAPSPGACSSAVAALLSLLAPFPFSLDYRPYFTIHDAAFARLAAGEVPTAANGLPMLLGLTNLYFLKALPEWPNVLSTGYTAATLAPSASNDRLDETANGSTDANGSSGGLQPSESAASIASSMGSSMAGGVTGAGRGAPASSNSGRWLGGTLRRTPASPAALLSGPVDHCWLQYKPHSRPDKKMLNRLVQPQPSDPADKWRRLAAVNSGMLRRHFQELTKALLFPLLPYLSPMLPPGPETGQRADPKAAEAAAQPPPLPPLDPAALLEQLAGRDAVLPEVLLEHFGGKKGLLAFYERFLRSPNLAAFMRTRRLAAEKWQQQRWNAAAAAAAAPMRELLAVEAFFRVEQQLAAAQVQLATAGGGGGASDSASGEAAAVAALASQLQEQLQLAFAGLPEDLQQAIRQTPSHAELLGDGGGQESAVPPEQAGGGG